MAAPILRNNVGANIVVTAANAVANNAYAAVADVMNINNTGLALLADFRLTSATFAAAPVTGSLQLFAVERSFANASGPTPSVSMQPKLVAVFSPVPVAGNAAVSWVMGANGVPLSPNADYWLYNAGTAQSLNLGWVLTAQLWSPGA